MRFVIFGLVGALFFSPGPAQAQGEPAAVHYFIQPRQMILVITKDWQAVEGNLQRFEFNGQQWQAVGPVIPVVVGRNGMGWGRGVHPLPQPGPQKREGDGKAPAGIFDLHFAFGSEPPEKLRGIKLPYIECTRSWECVDDPKSTHYNQVLDRKSIANPDWHSSENMLTTDHEYRLGVVVEQNSAPAQPGFGSCIFLHIWAGPGIGTSGCTAMREGDMESIVAWLDPAANPVLAQFPQSEYQRLKKVWQLPDRQ